MFKATCDVCARAVDNLQDLKDLEPRLKSVTMRHICATCGAGLTAKAKQFGTEKQNELVAEMRDWLTSRHDNNKKVIHS